MTELTERIADLYYEYTSKLEAKQNRLLGILAEFEIEQLKTKEQFKKDATYFYEFIYDEKQ